MGRPKPTDRDLRRRFAERAGKGPDGCWTWTGALDLGLHPRMSVMNRSGFTETIPASHVAWYLEYGEWTTRQLLHTCSRLDCTNPAHLRQGAKKTRSAAGWERSRKAAGLTDAQVAEIVGLWKKHLEHRQSVESLAKRFGRSRGTISRLLTSHGLDTRPR